MQNTNPNAQLISHRHQNINVYLLQPLLDVIQHVHWDGSDHDDLLGIVLEDEDHIKVLQLELDALEVDQLDVAQRHHERRLGRGREIK